MTPEEYLANFKPADRSPLSVDEFIDLVADALERRQTTNKPRERKLGFIDTDWVSGRPKVLFDGETVVSDKEYPYLSPKDWVADDRVAIELWGSTWIIVGKVV